MYQIKIKGKGVHSMVKLTPEDKRIFKAEIKKANPIEVLIVAEFIEAAPLSAKDKKFCISCIGKRCEKLLRNVVENFSFED